MNGFVSFSEKGHSVVLNQVLVPIIPYTTCSSDDYYGLYSTKVINKTMICAGYEHGIQDSCKVTQHIHHESRAVFVRIACELTKVTARVKYDPEFDLRS